MAKTLLPAQDSNTDGKILKSDGTDANWSDDLASHLAETVTQVGGVHGLTYEEGSFTPTVFGEGSAGTCTYSSRLGSYVRVGKIVFVTMALTWSNHTGTGALTIGDLPFVGVAGCYQAFAFTSDNLSFDGQLIARVSPNTTNLAFRGVRTDAPALQIPVDAAASLYLTGTYLIA